LQRAAGIKGGIDGYSNVCRARRQNASAGGDCGDTSQQREIESSGPLEISAERFNSSVARLTTNSIDDFTQLAAELQKMQEFLKSSRKCAAQIDSAVAGINIIVETIGPWKSIAGSQTLPSGTPLRPRGGPAANIEQRTRVG
jgi:hypothetical protein